MPGIFQAFLDEPRYIGVTPITTCLPCVFGSIFPADDVIGAVGCSYGPAGTVVFWHHRLGHNPGTNYVGENIRQAVLFDFIKKNVDDGPPPADMWRDWSEELRSAGSSGRTANARM